jgi:hypothetical protein
MPPIVRTQFQGMPDRAGRNPQVIWTDDTMASLGVCELVFEAPIRPTNFHIVRNDYEGFKQSLKLLNMRFRPFSLTDHLYVPGVLLSNGDEGQSKYVAVKVAFVWGTASGIVARKEGVHIGIDQDDCHIGLSLPVPVDFSYELIHVLIWNCPAQD